MKNLLNEKNNKVIGILGGMGPYATIMFMKNILDKTDAKKDWDHIRTVVDSNTYIPSRSRAILYNETSPLEGMVETCLKLQKYPVDIVVIPCNSACYWAHEVQKQVKVPIVNIVNVATNKLFKNDNVHKATAIGSMVVYQTDLYKQEIEKHGAEYVKIDEEDQQQVVEFIEKIKLGNDNDKLSLSFINFVNKLVEKYNLDGLILACTEFTQFKNQRFNIVVIDSSDSLAEYVIDYALNDMPLELDTQSIKTFWKKRAELLKEGKVKVLQSTMLTAEEEGSVKLDHDDKESVLKHIRHILNPEGTLLDIGCGNGRWARTLCKYVKTIDACDYCEDFIEVAKEISSQQKINNIRYFCASADNLNLEKEYDHVLIVGVLHYLDPEMYNNAICEITKAVKPGGYVIIRDPFGVGKQFELHGVYSQAADGEYHAIYRTSDYMIEKFGENFNVICDEVTLAPTESKPETVRKLIVLQKINNN